MIRVAFALALAAFVQSAFSAPDSDYEQPPIRYSDSEPTDLVARMLQRIERGEAKVEWTPRLGYLPAILRELDIPASSQGLVFAKRSLQVRKISPSTPRAIYFNDDAYVGFVQDGGLLELAAADPKLGAVFYSIDQTPPPDGGKFLKPQQLVREFQTCLDCHDNDVSVDIPGLKISSVFPDVRGNAIVAGGFGITDHRTPLQDRFGGWYVTGSLGAQATRANRFFQRQRALEPPTLLQEENVDSDGDGAVTPAELAGRFDTSAYLTPHSDVVAIMVLEHQVEGHNRITHATQTTLRALHAAGDSPPSEAAVRRINDACERLVEYLLFSHEATLEGTITGSSTFAHDFAARGPRDKRGRSLRDFDLTTRLFRYPLSYLVYSPTFDGLPDLARQRVYQRLWEVLNDDTPTKPFEHLTSGDRRTMIEILRDTKPGLPEHWLTRQ